MIERTVSVLYIILCISLTGWSGSLAPGQLFMPHKYVLKQLKKSVQAGKLSILSKTYLGCIVFFRFPNKYEKISLLTFLYHVPTEGSTTAGRGGAHTGGPYLASALHERLHHYYSGDNKEVQTL